MNADIHMHRDTKVVAEAFSKTDDHEEFVTVDIIEVLTDADPGGALELGVDDEPANIEVGKVTIYIVDPAEADKLIAAGQRARALLVQQAPRKNAVDDPLYGAHGV